MTIHTKTLVAALYSVPLKTAEFVCLGVEYAK